MPATWEAVVAVEQPLALFTQPLPLRRSSNSSDATTGLSRAGDSSAEQRHRRVQLVTDLHVAHFACAVSSRGWAPVCLVPVRSHVV
eukprot:scaffold78_cov609-Prasinococcus_capsulatus_cf.AAC.1